MARFVWLFVLTLSGASFASPPPPSPANRGCQVALTNDVSDYAKKLASGGPMTPLQPILRSSWIENGLEYYDIMVPVLPPAMPNGPSHVAPLRFVLVRDAATGAISVAPTP